MCFLRVLSLSDQSKYQESDSFLLRMETTGRVLIGVSTLGDSRAGYSSLGQFCMDKLSDSGDKTIIVRQTI